MTDIHILPVKPKPPKPHTWGAAQSFPASENNPEQRIWKCQNCPLLKITLLPEGKRVWRIGEGELFTGEAPVCVPISEAATP